MEEKNVIKYFNKQTHSEIILFHPSMECINVKPIPGTTGGVTSTSHQPYRITKSVQNLPLVIKQRVEKKKKKELEDRES